MHWLQPALEALALAAGTWIASRILKPKDHERAALLARIAGAAAAYVVSLNPNRPWAELLKLVVERVASAAGVPTKSSLAIENAAAQALLELGKAPDARK